MTCKGLPAGLGLPTEILDLGRQLYRMALPSPAACRRDTVRHATGKPAIDLLEVMTRARIDAMARKALGLQRNAQRKSDLIRLKAVAVLAWRSFRMSSDTCDLGDLAVAALDPMIRPAKALLQARHEIGAMLAEDVLIGTAEWGDQLVSKIRLPSATLEWLAGGADSKGGLTPRRLTELRVCNAAPTSGARRSADPLPSVSTLSKRICAQVVGLDEQVKSLSSRLVMHLARANLFRKGIAVETGNQAVLLLGSSGCGKTHLMESAAWAAGCPFASMSSTAMTAEGYVGGKLDDLFKSLVTKAKGDTQMARYGIAFADEWDKKAMRDDRDVNTLSIQQEILVPLQGAEFLISGKRGMERPFLFNSQGTFFAFAGVFGELAQTMKKLQGHSVIGFTSETRAKHSDYLLDALRSYGFVKEFVNRLTSVMWLPDPTFESLEQAAAHNILEQHNILLGEVGIVLKPQPGAIRRMVEYALESRTFYRGLKSVWGSISEAMIGAGVGGPCAVETAEVEAAIRQLATGGVRGSRAERPTAVADGAFSTGIQAYEATG